jgi:signal transduction histidine kinase
MTRRSGRADALAIVAHDLRAPLSAISISAELLAAMLTDPDHAVARQQVETIQRAAVRMRRMIDDLAAASTSESGALPVRLQPESISDVIDGAIGELTARLTDTGVTLAVRVPAALPTVRCDAARVRQVLANLVDNAAKHTPEGGTITVAAAARGDHVEVSVTDTGSGIAAEDLPHVFDAYWQGRDAGATSGLGLGLFICRSIASAHGGSIRVESTLGRGTTVTFALPRARDVPQA